ncbi:MAG: sulfatase [Phycisphaerales bacterium JB063]
MRYLLLGILLLTATACAPQQVSADRGAADKRSPRPLARPNIVLFLVDDMGWQDTSVQFGPARTFWNDHYRTPNMQRLADRGVKFMNAYAASPVCSPTRCAILTGQNPARTGITDWVGHGISENEQLRSPAWTEQGLQPGDGNLTLPQVLSDAGYLAAHVGKAHFGGLNTPGEDPSNLGFDINIGGSHAGSPRGQGEQGAYFAPFPQRLHPNMQHHPEGTYITDALTQDALGVIDRAIAEEKPFFLHLAHYAVHTPIAGQGDPRFLDHYPEDLPAVERHYAAMVESMDASLGAVMDHLEETGIASNTVILFFSDNGGLSNHTRATTDDDEDDVWDRDGHNLPAFSGKGSGYDGGVRVPMIVAWAADRGQRGTCNFPADACDLLPTLLGLAEIAPRVDGPTLDGADLTPFFRIDTERMDMLMRQDRSLFWHYPHQWYNAPEATREVGIWPFSAVRLGGYKLIYFYTPEGGELEVFEIERDLSELFDLQDNRIPNGLLPSLAGLLLDWLERTDAALPIDKATGETVDISNLREAAGR